MITFTTGTGYTVCHVSVHREVDRGSGTWESNLVGQQQESRRRQIELAGNLS